MRTLLVAAGCLALLVANVLLFATFVPIRPGAGTAYLLQMAVASLLLPALVVLAMLSRPRFRSLRSLLRGALVGLVGSLALSAGSIALSPPAPHPSLSQWNATEKQAHLDQRCREQCRNRGTSPSLCDELCSCTMEALFTAHSDEELQRLTVEGPYGVLSREANQLLGELGARCAKERLEAGGAAAQSSVPEPMPAPDGGRPRAASADG